MHASPIAHLAQCSTRTQAHMHGCLAHSAAFADKPSALVMPVPEPNFGQSATNPPTILSKQLALPARPTKNTLNQPDPDLKRMKREIHQPKWKEKQDQEQNLITRERKKRKNLVEEGAWGARGTQKEKKKIRRKRGVGGKWFFFAPLVSLQ